MFIDLLHDFAERLKTGKLLLSVFAVLVLQFRLFSVYLFHRAFGNGSYAQFHYFFLFSNFNTVGG